MGRQHIRGQEEGEHRLSGVQGAGGGATQADGGRGAGGGAARAIRSGRGGYICFQEFWGHGERLHRPSGCVGA